MRHREFLILTYRARTLSPEGMACVPWRKGKRYPTKPEGLIEPHASSQGHSGDRPAGKLPKSKRLRAGPPGTPNGICINAARPGECFCGKHWLLRREEQ